MFAAITYFKKRNKVLYYLFEIATVITLSYYITQDMPEIIPGIEKWYKLSSDLSIGVIVNFIFYIFQVYIPKREDEKNTLSIINPNLSKICDNMQEILLVLKTYLPGFDCGKIAPLDEHTVYYMLTTDSDLKEGWARSFDLYEDFTPLKETIARTTNELLSSSIIQGCEKDVIELLGQLQQNGFLQALEIAEFDRYDPQCNYGDLKECYPIFYDVFQELKKFAYGHKEKFIRPLTNEEIKFFKVRMLNAPQGKSGIPHIYIKSTSDFRGMKQKT